MRLTQQQQATIRAVLWRHFGSNSEIRLFGSRADDTAKGGDIDLYIEPDIQSPDQIVDARLNSLAELHMGLGEQKIDLLVRRQKGPELPIHRHAQATGVSL